MFFYLVVVLAAEMLAVARAFRLAAVVLAAQYCKQFI
jgi:hypothetical protein